MTPHEMTHGTAQLDEIAMHYVRCGAGPAFVLLHGFPQDWYEWRAVMAALASQHTVVAVDLRGVGGTDAPAAGYDAATMAADVHQLVERLALGPIHLVGHDVGGWVAYAYARLHPESLSRVTVIETLLAGTKRFENPPAGVPLWHGEFHMIPRLPEALVADRQATYFAHFFDIGTFGEGVFTADDIAHYAAAYGDEAHLRAAFEMYRAVPQNISFNISHREPIATPLHLIGGEHVFGEALTDTAVELRDEFGWRDVRASIVPDGKHYIVEERPDDVVALITHGTPPAVPLSL